MYSSMIHEITKFRILEESVHRVTIKFKEALLLAAGAEQWTFEYITCCLWLEQRSSRVSISVSGDSNYIVQLNLFEGVSPEERTDE